jgi:hypothetical protein
MQNFDDEDDDRECDDWMTEQRNQMQEATAWEQG